MPWTIFIVPGLFALFWLIRRAYLIPNPETLKNMAKGTNISHIYISSRFGHLRQVSLNKNNGQIRVVLPAKLIIEARGEIVELKSHMVGTFHWSRSKKTGRSFGRPGKRIKTGQVVAIVEALRLENEVVSPVDGTIVEVRVRNHQPIEYGQILALIERKQNSLV